MAFEIGIDIRNDVLFLTPMGEVSRESILQLGAEIKAQSDEQNLGKVLIDCDGMTGMFSVLELYSITPQFMDLVGQSCRIAYVNPPAEWTVEDDKFSRNVAYNRGGNLEVFELEADALNWLNS